MLSLLSRKSGAKIAFLFGFSLRGWDFFEGFPSVGRISRLSLPLRVYGRGPQPQTPSLGERTSGQHFCLVFHCGDGIFLMVRPSWDGFPGYLCPFGPTDVDPNFFARNTNFVCFDISFFLGYILVSLS